MGYTASHPFERVSDGDYCRAPDADSGSGTCAQYADHPIHAMSPDIEALARALAAHPWREKPDDLRESSEHRRHNYSYECALCVKDVHRLPAFFLNYRNGETP